MRDGQTWATEMERQGREGWSSWEKVQPKPKGHLRTGDTQGSPKICEDHRRLALNTDVLIPKHAARNSTATSSSSEATLDLPKTPTKGGHDNSGSLSDQCWSNFEESGFGNRVGISDRLTFDLTEAAKKEIMLEKRKTMTWDAFATQDGGFDRSALALQKTLSVSPLVQEQIESWPEERDEIRRKLKKSHKEMTKFDWDTTPNVVNTQDQNSLAFVEVGFVDVWTDLLLSAGWSNRDELTFREANWAIVRGSFCTLLYNNPFVADKSIHRWNTRISLARDRPSSCLKRWSLSTISGPS